MWRDTSFQRILFMGPCKASHHERSPVSGQLHVILSVAIEDKLDTITRFMEKFPEYQSRVGTIPRNNIGKEGLSAFGNALSDDGRYLYFSTALQGVDYRSGVTSTSFQRLYRCDRLTGANKANTLVLDPTTFSIGTDGQSGLLVDGAGILNFFNTQPGSVTLKNLVPGSERIRSTLIQR